MKHLELIGTDLKSDALNDLFETYDVDVVYQYDRSRENLPDEYVAQLPDLGLAFLFDSSQKLCTLFIAKSSLTGFTPFDRDEAGLPNFSSKNEAIVFANTNNVPISQGKADFLGEARDWVLLEYAEYSVHYEFVESELRMTTVQSRHA